MAQLHVTDYLSLLQKSGLLTAAQWETAQNAARELNKNRATNPAAASVESLASELTSQGLLTQWQADQLLKGQTGFVLGKYRLLTPVGKGGMGHVFKAHDSETGAIVAIKVMSRKLAGNQTLVNRFRREIRASSQLKSSNIVRTLDAGRVGKVDFMVMEFVNGDQLDRIISRINAIPVSIACDIIRQAAIGLKHAHEQKMVHRDIKPGNLIIDWSPDGTGTVKIMDMGLVRLHDDGEEKTSVTRAGQVMGTPDYMSPEQGWDTATVDSRSDIYSLGCTFFRLITGRVPFPGDNPLQVLMARCSRDAPSAKLQRAEIPDVIDGILRRMTLRDPAARYQTADELINSLMPFCSELTQASLRKAMLDAGLEDPDFVLELADDADSTNQDAGYQQFLKEMDSGAAVDLMINTSVGQNQSLSSTIPAWPQVDSRPGKPQPVAAKKNRTAATLVMASGGTALALIVLFVLVNRDSGTDRRKAGFPADTSVNGGGTQKKVETIPQAKLAPGESVTTPGGKTVNFKPQFDGSAPQSPVQGSLMFRLGAGAPAAATIDEQTGSVEWSIPQFQTTAEYFLPVEYVLSHNGATTVIAETKFSVNVEAAMTQYSLPRTPPIRSITDQLIEVSMAATPSLPEGTGLTYRLGKDHLSGMAVHPTTGLFTWTPANDDAGRHSVVIELCNTRTNEVLAASTIAMIVRPSSISLSLPAFAEQKAKAGEAFEMKLSERPMPFPGRVLQLKVLEGAPAGITIDTKAAMLRWQVPNDAKGRYEVKLKVELLLPDMELSPGAQTEATIVINVEPLTAPTLVPSDEEIAAADKEIRDLFKREIAQAKSASDRAALAGELFDRGADQTAGASDFALLNLAAEYADRSKATDVALDINRRRAARYQLDELTTAKQFLSEFRATSVNAGQHDAIVEHGIRLALSAAKAAQFSDVASLLQPASSLLKKTDRGTFARQLGDDIQQAIELADSLAKDSVSSNLKTQQLLRILDRWQFAGLFTAKESFSYVQSGDAAQGLPDSGRSLWRIENDQIHFEVKPSKGVLGFIETVREPGRFVIRMQISAQTTSAILILGASRDQSLDSHVITLDTSAFGQIATLPVIKVVVPGKPIASQPNGGWNDVEIFVDVKNVSIRLNGQQVSSSQLADLKPGRLGMLVSLERVTPLAKMDIRHARILVLPDAP